MLLLIVMFVGAEILPNCTKGSRHMCAIRTRPGPQKAQNTFDTLIKTFYVIQISILDASKLCRSASFGFSNVRIHHGPEAASTGAISYTWGLDIHFAPGHYNPNSIHGEAARARVGPRRPAKNGQGAQSFRLRRGRCGGPRARGRGGSNGRDGGNDANPAGGAGT